MTLHGTSQNSSGSESSEQGVSALLTSRSYGEARDLFSIYLSLSVCLIVLGILLNVGLCVIMVRRKRYQRNASNFFILHLCATELVYRLLVFPLTIYVAIPRSVIEKILCKSVSLFSETWRSTTFGNLVAIAIDRYQHIVHHFESLKSAKESRGPLISMVWLYAVLISFPLAISAESVPLPSIPEAQSMEFDNSTDIALCSIPQNTLGQFTTTLYSPLAFVFPLALITALYTKIAIFL